MDGIDTVYDLVKSPRKTMMKRTAATLVALCLLVAPAAGQSKIFRFFVRYGFGQGTMDDPNSEPSQSDIEGLMCATNEFLTDSIQNHMKLNAIQIYATEIDWGFEDHMYIGGEPEAQDPGKNVPVIVNFTATVTTTDDSTPPSNDDMWEATKYFDYFSYIQDYIWKIEGNNFFTSTRGLWYEPLVLPPVQGKLAESSLCPGGT